MKSLKFVILLQNLIAIVIAQEDCTLRGGESFNQSTPLNSTNTKWQVNLHAEKGNLNVDWLTIQRRTYNQKIPGPTIMVKKGDHLEILLIQFMVHKFTDIVVIHCHFLRHEDFGMMLLVDIIDPEEGDKTNVNPKSGNALPGQCEGPLREWNKLWLVMLLLIIPLALTICLIYHICRK